MVIQKKFNTHIFLTWDSDKQEVKHTNIYFKRFLKFEISLIDY